MKVTIIIVNINSAVFGRWLKFNRIREGISSFYVMLASHCQKTNKVGTYQGRSKVRGGGGWGSWGSADLLQINDIHNYCYAVEKLRAEMYIISTFLCSFNTN